MSTSFPYQVISGIAAQFTQLFSAYLESPPEFFYFSFLTCLGSQLADKITIATELQPQPRLYTILIGDSGDPRKSTAAAQTIKFFEDTFSDFHTCYGVGSAEGLQKKLAESSRLIVFFDEFKSFVSKCKIEASVLLPVVNTLFESNRYESHTKTSSIAIQNAFLSLIGCTTQATFDSMWTHQFTDIGFNNRLLLIPGTGKRKFPIPLKIPDNGKAAIRNKLLEINDWIAKAGGRIEFQITDDAWLRFDRWYRTEFETSVHAKRLETYALRLMPLLAINDGRNEIDYGIVEKIIALMEWQLEVRKELDPIDADSNIALLEEKIRRFLAKKEGAKRDIAQYCHASRYGTWCFETAIANLLRFGEISFDRKKNLFSLMCSQMRSQHARSA